MSKLTTFFKQFSITAHSMESIFNFNSKVKKDNILLFKSKFKISKQNHLEIEISLKTLASQGFTNYISVADINNSQVIKLNDGISQMDLPEKVFFFNDEFLKKHKKMIMKIINIQALKKLYRFSKSKFENPSIILPTVSIVVTNYNYEDYLQESLESILMQDYPYIERFIVDDCSTDTSVNIMNEYSNCFKIIKHKKNMGQLKGFFSGIKKASGSFIVFVDADDILDPHAISAGVSSHLLESPPVAFTCLRNRQINENSQVLNNFHLDFKSFNQKKLYTGHRILYKPFWKWSTTTAMMFRKDVLDLLVIENTEDFRICADYYLVHFANLMGGSMLIDIDSVGYRRHGKNNFSKNFIIGGHTPTGHMIMDNHPEHKLLWKNILEHIWSNKDKFERYFNSYDSFIQRLALVAPYEFAMTLLDMDKKTSKLYQNASDSNRARLEQFKLEDNKIRKTKAKKLKKLKRQIINDYELNTFFQI